MMNPRDALTLARTKLRAHRIRTGVTVVVSGLLFGLIIAGLFFVQGVFTSVDRYSEVGLNNRYILNIAYSPYQSMFNVYENYENQEFIAEVEQLHKEHVARKQAAATKYSVPYDPASEDPSPIEIDPLTKHKSIADSNFESEIVLKAVEARTAANRKPFSITEYISPYKTATYLGESKSISPENGSLMYMKRGNENQQFSSNSATDYMITNGSGASLTFMDESIAEVFVTNNSFDPAKGEIPVILPFSEAEKLLGLSRLSKDASTSERKERLDHVRANVGNITADFCYRSEASRALMVQAVAQQDTLKRYDGVEGFEAPTLIYNAPNETDCSAITIKSDTRSQAEKQADANRVLYEKELGIWLGEPEQIKITVRGVGISGDTDMGSMGLSPATLVKGLLNSNLGYNGWVIPEDLFAQLPDNAKPEAVFAKNDTPRDLVGYESYLVEFGDKEEARDVLRKTGAYTGNFDDIMAAPFGSGTLFIDEIRTWVERVLKWALVVVGSIAAFTLWGIIGRTIADSRRESAVFRAIGATRSDIASIYGLYALLLSFRVAGFALLLGLTTALIVDVIFSGEATLTAQLAYAATDTDIKFGFIDIFSWYALIVLGVIVLIGLLSSIIPIALGVKRSPINDMRDDS